MICSSCNIQMINVISFSNEKHEKFCHCKKCKQETKHKKLQDEELDFVEVLSKKLHKTGEKQWK